jgi:hypothetical protein
MPRKLEIGAVPVGLDGVLVPVDLLEGWMDREWAWYPEYDRHYGKPLGRAMQTTDPPGWRREFEGCMVTADLLNASIAFHNHTN